MKTRYRIALLVLALTSVAPSAFAGERTAVSAVPTLQEVKLAPAPATPPGIPGVKATTKETSYSKYVELSAQTKQGYCIVSTEDGRLSLMDATSGEYHEAWRFQEKDGTATLDVMQIDMSTQPGWVRSQTRVELRALTKEAGVTVWGAREKDGTLVALASRGTSGIEAMNEARKNDDVPMLSFASSSCSFSAVRLTPLAFAKGATAQLTGSYPDESGEKNKPLAQFVIDFSVSKLSRDPEPMLSVRVRRIEPRT